MIEVAGLTKRFGDLVAVDALSFTAPAGRVTAVLGPNGAGKTTTFRVLLGLARPTAGQALIEGRRYEELERPRQTVGAVLESSGFHPARTGRDHLRVIAAAAGIARSRVDELLAFVGLARAADRRVGGYSTGMRQLLAEVVQTADRALIIARGRALREADLSSLGGATELAVRVDDPESLARALSA